MKQGCWNLEVMLDDFKAICKALLGRFPTSRYQKDLIVYTINRLPSVTEYLKWNIKFFFSPSAHKSSDCVIQSLSFKV